MHIAVHRGASRRTRCEGVPFRSALFVFFSVLARPLCTKGIRRCVKLEFTLLTRETAADTDSKISQVTLTRYIRYS